MTEPTQFEGRTAEEALARARDALGPGVELRCWKTRRGGIAGFFATEVYLAGPTPPAGAERGRRGGAHSAPHKSLRRRQGEAEAASTDSGPEGDRPGSKGARATGPAVAAAGGGPGVTAQGSTGGPAGEPGAGLSGPRSVRPVPPTPHDPGSLDPDVLAELVDRTDDQVSLQFAATSAETFRDVLAEAEAVLAGDAPSGDTSAGDAGTGDGAASTGAPQRDGDTDGGAPDGAAHGHDGTAQPAPEPAGGAGPAGDPPSATLPPAGAAPPAKPARRTSRPGTDPRVEEPPLPLGLPPIDGGTPADPAPRENKAPAAPGGTAPGGTARGAAADDRATGSGPVQPGPARPDPVADPRRADQNAPPVVAAELVAPLVSSPTVVRATVVEPTPPPSRRRSRQEPAARPTARRGRGDGERRSRVRTKVPRSRTTTATKAELDAAEHPSGPERIPRAQLRALGVPDGYLPRGRPPTLDSLARAMGTLPKVPALPADAGAVIAIVGPAEAVRLTGDLVADQLDVDEDLVWADDDAELELGGRAPTPFELSSLLQRRVARRVAEGRTSLVAVPSVPGTPPGSLPLELLDVLGADYVLGAAHAWSKREDVEHWLAGLDVVDALALWDLDSTQTPAEVMGLAPVAFLDGVAASAIAWTLALARRALVAER